MSGAHCSGWSVGGGCALFVCFLLPPVRWVTDYPFYQETTAQIPLPVDFYLSVERWAPPHVFPWCHVVPILPHPRPTARRSPSISSDQLHPIDPLDFLNLLYPLKRPAFFRMFSRLGSLDLSRLTVALSCFFPSPFISCTGRRDHVPVRYCCLSVCLSLLLLSCCCCLCCCLLLAMVSMVGWMRGLLAHRYHDHHQPQSTESQATALIVVASVIGLVFSVIQFMLIASVK